ncbi:MAG: hypothetical protein B7Z23_04085 [Pseudomonadales bacterium 32-61-5]|nr:MAG: hypothetical protein B7Z23_04085 [Pseudomonadales bacterium 32-61-5]
MNQYTGVSINPEAVIQVLAEAYPKTLSMTTLQGKLHAGRPRIESGLMVLAASALTGIESGLRECSAFHWSVGVACAKGGEGRCYLPSL